MDAERRLRAPVAVQFDTRRQKRGAYLDIAFPDGKPCGPVDLSLGWAVGEARSIAAATGFELPEVQDAAQLAEAASSLLSEISRRGHDLRHDADLRTLGAFGRLVETPRQSWLSARNTVAEARRRLAELVAEHGPLEDSERSLTQLREDLEGLEESLSALSGRAAVLAKAKDWVEQQPERGDTNCPVCESAFDLTDLKPIVERALESTGRESGGLVDEIKRKAGEVEVQSGILALLGEASKSRDETQDLLVKARSSLNNGLEEFRGAFKEEQRGVSRIGRVYATVPEDAGSAEDDRLETGLRRLAVALEEERERIKGEADGIAVANDGLRQRATNLQYLADFLAEDEKLAHMRLAEGFQALDGIRDTLQEARLWGEAIAKAQEFIRKEIEESATSKLDTISGDMCDWFKRVSKHDQFTEACFEVNPKAPAGKKYAFYAKSEAGWEAACEPELSGGYRTCLAVAALCALTCLPDRTHKLDALLLDEPTQHLDPGMRKCLGETIGRRLIPGQVVVSTYDREFLHGVEETAGEDAVVYEFDKWTLADGSRLKEAI